MKRWLLVFAITGSFWGRSGSETEMPEILNLEQRAAVMDRWLGIRLQTVVPALMRREGIDMWILSAREYNEDPVLKTMLPATWFSARRRTILVFFDPGAGSEVEALAIARYDIGGFFKSVWDKSKQPDQWRRLVALIEEKQPKKLALNRSSNFALADGMTHTEFEAFWAVLPETFRSRVVSGEALAIGWLETRIPEEMRVYPTICKIAHRIIAEGFSNETVTPGTTTTQDVVWFYRERIGGLGLTAWFHPTVSIQRMEDPEHSGSFASRPEAGVIQPGDLLHVDFGITYLGLNTDTQQHAYVLRPGENAAPEGLNEAFKIGNRLQDILTARFKTGATGNRILAEALKQAQEEGIKATIYTHPIGYHGHGAGPTIGLWDQQEGVPGQGDYSLYANTAYSIELNATVQVPEWKKEIRIMLEEDGFFTGTDFYYIDGRQQQLILIGDPE